MNKLRKVTILRAATAGGAVLALSLAMVPGAHAAAGTSGARPVLGVDVSSHQHPGGAPIDWLQLARDGVRFAAIKASEGTYYVNPYYSSDARAAAAADIAVLPYVFANPGRAGGAATARFAVRAVGAPRGPTRLPLVVDLENNPYGPAECYGLDVPAMVAWIAGFIGVIRALAGQWPVIYTTAAWWQECTSSAGRFWHDPLWLAAYGGTAAAAPSPWRQWTFWQYDVQGYLPGVGQTDLDYYEPTGRLPSLDPLAR